MLIFRWNDVGGFNSLEEVFEKDDDDNIIVSDRKSRLVTSLGVSNVIIVDTKEELPICNKNEA